MSNYLYTYYYSSYANAAAGATYLLANPPPASPPPIQTTPNYLDPPTTFFNNTGLPATVNVFSSTSPSITLWKLYRQPAGQSYALNSQTFDGSGQFGGPDVLNKTGVDGDYYILYPASDGPPCFLEGSTLTCLVGGEDKEVPIEKIRKGTLVKTLKDGYKKVELIGSRPIGNPGDSERTQNRLYKLSKEKYPELKEDLYLTGCHSILVDSITEEEKEETIKQLEVLHITDGKVRLMANIDKRAEPWVSEGEYTVWHLALECEDDGLNFGVYANGGLLVETCSIRYLKNKSKMTFH